MFIRIAGQTCIFIEKIRKLTREAIILHDGYKEKAKVNKGIACSVKTCSYNDNNGHCTAEKIAVGPSSASCCADTVCATYRPRHIG